MLFYTTLFLVFWALIFTAARFLQYFRIVKNYKEETQATVTQIRDHEPASKKEFFSLIRSMERKEVLRSLFPGSRQSGIRSGAGSGSAIMRKKTALCT